MLFNDGEMIADFTMCLTSLVIQLRLLGELISDKKVVRNFLSIVPPSIPISPCASRRWLICTHSVEELTGMLKAVKERYNLDSEDTSGSKLLLTEEWQQVQHKRRESDGSSGGNSGNSSRCCGRALGRYRRRSRGNRNSGGTMAAARHRATTCAATMASWVTGPANVARRRGRKELQKQ